ncbi:hypothetical protein VFPBJ_08090 [Purpureocillium lilacinum]|uniref:Uncharacterized protein n=1 Tax=Purpureocillium lilacinum TaxID=33203 RepID=A0A179GJC7_PURLI|nr:hypothetical protein VFPBJ_08090 [Purpureocillium lilacinum]
MRSGGCSTHHATIVSREIPHPGLGDRQGSGKQIPSASILITHEDFGPAYPNNGNDSRFLHVWPPVRSKSRSDRAVIENP